MDAEALSPENSTAIAKYKASLDAYITLLKESRSFKDIPGALKRSGIAILNLNKRGGYGSANTGSLRKYAVKYREEILNEVKILDPDVIVFGGGSTMEVFKRQVVFGLEPGAWIRNKQPDIGGHEYLYKCRFCCFGHPALPYMRGVKIRNHGNNDPLAISIDPESVKEVLSKTARYDVKLFQEN